MTSPLRVLHVIPSISPKRGGPSTALVNLAPQLASLGCVVDVLATNDDGPGKVELSMPYVDFHSGVTWRYFDRTTRFYTFAPHLSRWLRSHVQDYDVLHIHALFSWPSVSAARIAQRRGVPYIIAPLGALNPWGLQNRRAVMKRVSLALIERRILQGAAAVQYATELELREGLRAAPRQNPTVIPPGIAPQQTEGTTNSEFEHLRSVPTIVFLGRLDRSKALEVLIDAMSLVREDHPTARLVIAGDGDETYGKDLRAQTDRLGISEGVEWAGFVSVHEQRALFEVADVSVLPSFSESFGIAAVEALAHNVATVVSDGVGVAAQLKSTGAALVVKSSGEEVASAISKLLSNGDLRRKTLERGRRLVDTTFAIDAVADRVLGLYRATLAGSRSSE